LKLALLILFIGIFSVIFSVSYAEKIMCKEGLELVLKSPSNLPLPKGPPT